jgi:hypothetical protein
MRRTRANLAADPRMALVGDELTGGGARGRAARWGRKLAEPVRRLATDAGAAEGAR